MAKLAAFINGLKFVFNQCMTVPDYNSRLVFLLHGLAVAFGLVFLTIAFVWAKNPDAYPYMVGALGGSATLGAAGRWLTKKESPPTKPTIPDSA